jgi:O-antigen/teichoic acid export membrane protein
VAHRVHPGPSLMREELPSSTTERVFLRRVLLLVGGAAGAQVVPILATPLLTRIYVPTDYGLHSLYVSLLSILLVIACAKFELAIPLAHEEADARKAFVLALAACGSLALLVTCLISGWADGIASLFGAPAFARYAWILPVGLVAGGVTQALSHWAIRTENYKVLSEVRLRQSVVQVVSQGVLGLLSHSPTGLMVGEAMGRAAGAHRLTRSASGLRPLAAEGIRSQELWPLLRRYRRFPMLTAPSALINAAGLYLPAALLLGFYGVEAGGQFGLTQRVVGLPVGLIGLAVAQVYLGDATSALRRGRALSRTDFWRLVRHLLAVGAPPALVLLLAGPFLFSFVFGQAWAEAGRFAQLLALAMLSQFIAVPLSQTLTVIGRQGVQLAWDVTRLALTVGALVGSHYAGLKLSTAVGIYGAAVTLSYIALLLLTSHALGAITGPLPEAGGDGEEDQALSITEPEAGVP